MTVKNNQGSNSYTLGKFSSDGAEKLRFLRTNFLSAVKKSEDDPRVILCAADCKADELARAVLDLGCALTALGKKVLVIDIDRKNARVRELVGKSGKTFNDYLAGRATADELGEKTEVKDCYVVASDADGLVGMSDDVGTAKLLSSFKSRFDFVFVIASPVKDGSDAFSCDEASDAVMLFVKKDFTRMGFISKMLGYYEGRGRRVLGTVLI